MQFSWEEFLHTELGDPLQKFSSVLIQNHLTHLSMPIY